MLDRLADRAARRGYSLSSFLEVRIHLVKLSHLPGGSPSCVTLPGTPQIKLRDVVEAARCVEAGRRFVGDRFIVDKPVCAG